MGVKVRERVMRREAQVKRPGFADTDGIEEGRLLRRDRLEDAIGFFSPLNSVEGPIFERIEACDRLDELVFTKVVFD
jgi:hypothetical protein